MRGNSKTTRCQNLKPNMNTKRRTASISGREWRGSRKWETSRGPKGSDVTTRAVANFLRPKKILRLIAKNIRMTIEGKWSAIKRSVKISRWDFLVSCLDHNNVDWFFCFQFRSRRDYNQHIEEHKQEAIKKVRKHIRSLLLVNKHGLLLDEVWLCDVDVDFMLKR